MIVAHVPISRYLKCWLAEGGWPVNSDIRYSIRRGRIFHHALESAGLPEGGVAAVEVDGWPAAIARVDGRVHAVLNRCSHAAAAFVPGGRMRRGVVMCPAHGARFDVTDGRCIGAAYAPLRTFACREAGGRIEIDLPDHPPSPDERPVTR